MKPKLLVIVAAAALLIGNGAHARSFKSRAVAGPTDRYFDAAHGPRDPQSLWVAGDYVGRDPDPAIRASMTRESLVGFSR
jgi:hypothetical protein